MRSGEADPGAMVAAGLAALDGACLGVGQALEFAGALLDRVDHVGRASATAEKRLGWVRLATAVADRARGLADLLVGQPPLRVGPHARLQGVDELLLARERRRPSPALRSDGRLPGH